jgi:ketosteroid isomerase-like protein
MAHPNEGLLKKGYEAFGKGDIDTLRELFAPDIVWHAAGTGSLSGDYKGVDEVLGFFGRLTEATEGTFKIEIHDMLVNDEHGVVLSNDSASKGGTSQQGQGVEVYHIKDGKLTEAWTMSFDQAAFDKFLG